LFFDFYSGNEGDELFISDGTVSGTFMYELFPGNTSAYPEDFMVIGNTIIMNAYTAQYPQGCMVFIDENLISNEIATRIAVETDYAEFNGIIYFSGYESSTGNELWRTDGTPNGTWLISDILPGAMGSSPDNLTWCGSKLYFTANSGTLSQPHVSNGTADGTFMLADLFNNGTVGSFAHDFTFLNGNTFFIARTGFIDFHIFKTDGTVSGTEQIFAQDATNFSNPLGEGSIVISNPGSIHLANNSIWMSADYHGISKELYVIDDGQINHITDEQIVASRISIDVYPNPTETFLNITSNDDLLQEIIIFDMTGRTIYQERCNQNSRLVDVSKLASGTYLLTTSTPLSHQSIVVIKK
jgi:ELWxxDGT repeat protein